MTEPLDLKELRDELRAFTDARDWQQFHTPKNLAMAVAGEAGELLEVFQWLTPEGSATLSDDDRGRAADEIADVMIYLVRLADVLDVDLGEAVADKVHRNAARYPADRSRGSAAKAPPPEAP